MREFDLSLSRLEAGLVGMNRDDARHFWTMAAALRAFDARMTERDRVLETNLAR